jgi:hypothetical protein
MYDISVLLWLLISQEIAALLEAALQHEHDVVSTDLVTYKSCDGERAGRCCARVVVESC